jgi:CrcB protein
MIWLAIAAGGALGSVARHGVNVLIHGRWPMMRFPLATLIVNVLGCLIIGMLAGLVMSERIVLRFHWREFLFVGVLGGFTTFSTFGLDTYMLARTHPGQAALNVGLQVVGGLLAVWLGYQAGWLKS